MLNPENTTITPILEFRESTPPVKWEEPKLKETDNEIN
jgi:hypothetical protein